MKQSSNRLFATIVVGITLMLGGGALALLNGSASAATGGADGITEACANGVLSMTNTSGSDGFLTNQGLNGGDVFVASGATVAFPGTADFAVYAEDGTVIGTANYDPNCTPPPVDLIHVTPQAPTSADACGTANDSVSTPTQVGVVYASTGNVASGTVTVTASAATGYVLDGTTSWMFTFTNVACPVTPTPTPTPTHEDPIPVTV